MGVVDGGPRSKAEGRFWGFDVPIHLISLNEVFLRATSKSANILKAALRRHHIANVLQVFKSGAVFDALHQRRATSNESVNNSGIIQIAVVIPSPYLHCIFR